MAVYCFDADVDLRLQLHVYPDNLALNITRVNLLPQINEFQISIV